MVSKIRYARPTSQRASLTLSRSADQAILNNEMEEMKAFPLVTNQRRMLASARSWHDNARGSI